MSTQNQGMTRMGRLLLIPVVMTLSLLGWSAAASAETEVDEPGVPQIYDLPNLSEEENGLLNSGQPLVGTLDPATGKLLDVQLDTSTSVSPFSVTKNNCSGNKACWYGWSTPDAYYGFNGSGGSGTWDKRGSFNTAIYHAKPCWKETAVGPTICSEVYMPPNFQIQWGVSLIGKSVSLY